MGKALTAGLIAGIAVAIVMSAAALGMLVTLNEKIRHTCVARKGRKILEVGAPGINKNEVLHFYYRS